MNNRVQFLVSAGEASGDMYAAGVVDCLRAEFPQLEFYGCAGPRLQKSGVRPVIDASKLAVVGLAEVVGHLPGIYAEYRKLIRYIRRHPPVAALLTDSPDFHLRLARHLKRMGVPVFYLVAPQVWAWRQGRVKTIKKLVDKLFCLFPFEEAWFRERGVDAIYIGHPLARTVRCQQTREAFFGGHGLNASMPLVTLLPGSRAGEACRHMPVLLDAIALLRERLAFSAVLATPLGFKTRSALEKFRERIESLSIKVVEGETWDATGHADLALAASGTVTVEAAVLGTPCVTFYKVTPLTWHGGRRLVKVPFLSMVNLIAGRKIVPELIQDEMTAAAISAEAERLLTDAAAADAMRSDLLKVRDALTAEGDALERAAHIIGLALTESVGRAPVQC